MCGSKELFSLLWKPSNKRVGDVYSGLLAVYFFTPLWKPDHKEQKDMVETISTHQDDGCFFLDSLLWFCPTLFNERKVILEFRP